MFHNRWLRSGVSLIVAALMIGSISYIGVHTYKASHASTVPTIYASPDKGTIASGSILSVTLRADSGSEAVNSVQASLNYDASKLSYSSITDSDSYPLVAATSTSTPGVIRIGRGNNDKSLTGDNAIVTINFRVTGTSGTGTITLDKAYSALVRSSDSTDILGNVGTGTYTISSSTAGGGTVSSPTPQPQSSSNTSVEKPVMTLSPSSGNMQPGSPLSVAIRLNSYNYPVSTAEAIISYPAGQLQYTGVTEGGVYTTKQRTKADPGLIDIIRAIPGGNPGVKGENTIVTLNFKVIGASGPVSLAFTQGTAAYDTSGSGQNILNLGGSKGAGYTIGATSSNPITVLPLNNAADKATTAAIRSNTISTPSQAMYVSSGSGKVAISSAQNGSPHTELAGEVQLSPILDPEVQQAGGIQKVEYFLEGTLVYTAKTSPYTFSFDTKSMRNGVYEMGVKTFLASGIVNTKTDKLHVNNPITMAYVARHYYVSILTTLALLAVLGLLIVKLAIPRLRHADNIGSDTDHDALYGFTDHQSGEALVASDPHVVAPTGASVVSATLPLQPQFSSVAQTTDALPMTPAGITAKPVAETAGRTENNQNLNIPIQSAAATQTTVSSRPIVSSEPVMAASLVVPRPVTPGIITRPAGDRFLSKPSVSIPVVTDSDTINHSQP